MKKHFYMALVLVIFFASIFTGCSQSSVSDPSIQLDDQLDGLTLIEIDGNGEDWGHIISWRIMSYQN